MSRYAVLLVINDRDVVRLSSHRTQKSAETAARVHRAALRSPGQPPHLSLRIAVKQTGVESKGARA